MSRCPVTPLNLWNIDGMWHLDVSWCIFSRSSGWWTMVKPFPPFFRHEIVLLAGGKRALYLPDLFRGVAFREWSRLEMFYATIESGGWTSTTSCWSYLAMNQYLLIPFLERWTSIYQLFWCSPGVQGFDTLPFWCQDFHPYPYNIIQSHAKQKIKSCFFQNLKKGAGNFAEPRWVLIAACSGCSRSRSKWFQHQTVLW